MHNIYRRMDARRSSSTGLDGSPTQTQAQAQGQEILEGTVVARRLPVVPPSSSITILEGVMLAGSGCPISFQSLSHLTIAL